MYTHSQLAFHAPQHKMPSAADDAIKAWLVVNDPKALLYIADRDIQTLPPLPTRAHVAARHWTDRRRVAAALPPAALLYV
jgi:hypothetical protein